MYKCYVCERVVEFIISGTGYCLQHGREKKEHIENIINKLSKNKPGTEKPVS